MVLSPLKRLNPYFDRCAEDFVRLGVVGKTDRGWIEIEVSGEYKSAALSNVEYAIRRQNTLATSLESNH
jgi:hypothetical protein